MYICVVCIYTILMIRILLSGCCPTFPPPIFLISLLYCLEINALIKAAKTYVHTHKYLCMCMHTHTHTHTHMHVHTYTYIYGTAQLELHFSMRGTTRILHCIPITCLHGIRLLLVWNVHVSWKYTRVST